MPELTKSGFRRLEIAKQKIQSLRLDILNSKLSAEDTATIEKAWQEFSDTVTAATQSYTERQTTVMA